LIIMIWASVTQKRELLISMPVSLLTES
jgi:hypothetical protein